MFVLLLSRAVPAIYNEILYFVVNRYQFFNLSFPDLAGITAILGDYLEHARSGFLKMILDKLLWCFFIKVNNGLAQKELCEE